MDSTTKTKTYIETVGRRKTSVARVRVSEASKNSEDSIDASHKQGTTTPVSIRVRRKGERVKDSVNAAAVNAAVPVTHATRNEARDDNDE